MVPSIEASAAHGLLGDAPERPKLTTGKCVECDQEDLVLDPILARCFELQVCVACKQDRNLRFGWYELISKSRAKVDYALPDSFFHGLPFLARPNPRHESFAPLKLYLKKTVIEEATRLYGDDAGIEEEKDKRKRKSYERAAQRTKGVLKKRRSDVSSGDSPDERVTEPPVVYVPVADHDHKHHFASEKFDDAANSWVKECDCGMRVHFEKW